MSSGISTFLCKKQRRGSGSEGKCNKKRAKETTRWRLGRPGDCVRVEEGGRGASAQGAGLVVRWRGDEGCSVGFAHLGGYCRPLLPPQNGELNLKLLEQGASKMERHGEKLGERERESERAGVREREK